MNYVRKWMVFFFKVSNGVILRSLDGVSLKSDDGV